MGITATYETQLSPGQARFALEHDAHAGMNTQHDEVYLYREDLCATYRWVVDHAGRTLEAQTFRKSPPEPIERRGESRLPRFTLQDRR
jgi:hypothetical protein